MNLVVDIGNSFSKIAVFKGEQMHKLETTPTLDKPYLQQMLKSVEEKVRHVILSSVRPYSGELDEFFSNCFRQYMRLSHEVKLPIRLNYKTPNTLGMDRLAAVAGAAAQFPQQDLLVIDAGTCITYDFLDRESKYEGGSISPGIRMRFKALHNFTGQLPLITWKGDNNITLLGDNTENSILSGVVNGVRSEVEGIVAQYEASYPDLKVLLTGGDMETFDKVLKNRIFADPNLVVKGLNEILRYNIED